MFGLNSFSRCGNELVSDFVSREIVREIGFVDSVRHFVFTQMGQNFFSGNIEKRPDDIFIFLET